MKNLLTLLLLISYNLMFAQIHGNGNMKTITREFESIDHVLININGSVNVINNSPENKIEITYDENIVELVSTSYNNNQIEIGQKEWIEGSSEVDITIYTHSLKSLNNDSWSNVELINIEQTELRIIASIGDISLEGSVDDLLLEIESAHIDAKNLITKNANINITEDGKAIVNVNSDLKYNISEDGKLKNIGKTKIDNLKDINSLNKFEQEEIDTRFINVSFKNNSMKLIHAYVKGPKPGGNYFSYGLSFFPMAKKNESWSIGTKLFRVNKLGVKTLLHEVTESDENRTIKIHKS